MTDEPAAPVEWGWREGGKEGREGGKEGREGRWEVSREKSNHFVRAMMVKMIHFCKLNYSIVNCTKEK